MNPSKKKTFAVNWNVDEYDLVCVLGPTASGKTRYAVRLAKEISRSLGMGDDGGCEIISADSRQVYRGMDIGTGKDLCDYDGVPYHLIDIVDAGERYNVFRFKEDFDRAYADIRSRGKYPILCGGTGMYINAVTQGYDFSSSQALSAPKQRRLNTLFIGTLVTREERNARIDARLDARLSEGMVEEIRGLLDKGVPEEVLISYGLEYKFVTLYLRGDLTYSEMRDKLAIAIHQFAKRQMTWFRGMERSGVVINWVKP